MADINKSKFDKHVTGIANSDPAATAFQNVSSGFAKHLDYNHPFSSRVHAQDQSDGRIPAGVLFANDAYFVANSRASDYQEKNGGALAYPVNGDTIALCEWPTNSRIHGIRAIPTTAAMDPGSFNLEYFPAGTAAAFPAFTLVAMDPNDPGFTPIPLLETVTETLTDSDSDTVDVTRQQISLAALSYGINRRRDPLVIAAVLGGNVVANSGLFVLAEFVRIHV